MAEPLNLESITKTWLNQCGIHDAGMPEYGCACPEGDPRSVISQLVDEVKRLELEVTRLREAVRRG